MTNQQLGKKKLNELKKRNYHPDNLKGVHLPKEKFEVKFDPLAPIPDSDNNLTGSQKFLAYGKATLSVIKEYYDDQFRPKTREAIQQSKANKKNFGILVIVILLVIIFFGIAFS